MVVAAEPHALETWEDEAQLHQQLVYALDRDDIHVIVGAGDEADGRLSRSGLALGCIHGTLSTGMLTITFAHHAPETVPSAHRPQCLKMRGSSTRLCKV
jgi:hypothetical protein